MAYLGKQALQFVGQGLALINPFSMRLNEEPVLTASFPPHGGPESKRDQFNVGPISCDENLKDSLAKHLETEALHCSRLELLSEEGTPNPLSCHTYLYGHPTDGWTLFDSFNYEQEGFLQENVPVTGIVVYRGKRGWLGEEVYVIRPVSDNRELSGVVVRPVKKAA